MIRPAHVFPGVAAGALLAMSLASGWAAQPAGPPAPTNMTQFVAPGAMCVAVGDSLGMVVAAVAGHPHQLAIYRIDGAGEIAGEPDLLRLPVPESLKANQNRGTAVLFHPSLPVLYAWQNLTTAAPPTAHDAEFDHLLVFAVKDGTLTPVIALGRGPQFAQLGDATRMAVDPKGRRLFMPNLLAGANRPAAGFYELGSDGRPILVDGVIKPTTVDVASIPGSVTGMGIVATNPDAVVLSLHNGPATWDTTNRLGALNHFAVHQHSNAAYMCGSPDGRWVYGASAGRGLLYAMRHADGFITMLPSVMPLNTCKPSGFPVVLPGDPRLLAIPCSGAVAFISLDGEGRPTDQVRETPIANPAIRALGWSDRHKRLYIPVDKLP